MAEIKDRYVSFENIDCYKNAIEVLDCIYEVFEKYPESKNAFWQRFDTLIPADYKNEFTKEGSDILYQVCSNVFYIDELFEEYEYEKGIELLEKAELECC